MNTADRFLKFATECQIMARSTRSARDRAVWKGLAERWVRCAYLIDQKHPDLRRAGPARRQRTPSHSFVY